MLSAGVRVHSTSASRPDGPRPGQLGPESLHLRAAASQFLLGELALPGLLLPRRVLPARRRRANANAGPGPGAGASRVDCPPLAPTFRLGRQLRPQPRDLLLVPPYLGGILHHCPVGPRTRRYGHEPLGESQRPERSVQLERRRRRRPYGRVHRRRRPWQGGRRLRPGTAGVSSPAFGPSPRSSSSAPRTPRRCRPGRHSTGRIPPRSRRRIE
mmetsp:Transcript_60642/g.179820  ORF Transcript_60642/g.179820 Transcript_60642/m.179820 type:complete len:213 (+) Transcript_60642:639-1277(+)